MSDLVLGGVPVSFPKEPYQCQIKYMEQNILALNGATNALLESPTGTGKTLCLLCSSLAWQKHNMKSPPVLAYSSGQSVKGLVPKDPSPKQSSGSLIIYASRTHSQISQVVSELRATVYRPRMTVMGSRDQLCIHEKISKLRGGALNHACNTLAGNRGCTYKNNLESFGGALGDEKSGCGVSRPVLDIEELVQVGRSQRICPYFYSRDVSTNSEMVLLPYNYLLDSSIRQSLKLAWQDAIVIFDEGHNLEKVASDAASCSFSSTDIATCIVELQQALTILREEQELQRLNGTKGASEEADDKKQSVGDATSSEGVVLRPKLGNVVVLLTAMFKLEETLNGLSLSSGGVGATPSIVLPGVYLRDTLQESGFSGRGHGDELKRCANMLMEKAEDAMGTFDGAGGGGGAVLSVTVPTLMQFAGAVDRIFKGERGGQYGDYKVYISDEEVRQGGAGGGGSGSYTSSKNGFDFNKNKFNKGGGGGNGRVSMGGGGGGGSSAAAVTKKRVINYWCFSPGIAMEELKALGVRSIILTSGTLSPMGALREDMKLPFPVQLENPHVIGKNQMWVGALSMGPRGKPLNSTFQNRDSTDYKDELGMSILTICLTMSGRGNAGMTSGSTSCAVPLGQELRGGVLVFCPSYAVMEGYVTHWKQTGLYDRLRNVVGSVIVEPKGTVAKLAPSNSGEGEEESTKKASKAQPQGFMAGNTYKKASAEGSGGGGGEEDVAVQGVLGEFEAAMKRHGGCLLLAVCRGKVSEGIDFSDSKGRVVIVTGIPFAPFMDPWVVLKKQYLDERCGGVVAGGGAAKPQIAMTGYSAANNPYNSYPSLSTTTTTTISANLSTSGSSTTSSALAVKNMWSTASASSAYPAPPPGVSTTKSAAAVTMPGKHSTMGGYYAAAPVPLVGEPKSESFAHPAVAVAAKYTPLVVVAPAAKKGTMNGQMWYCQSASRAVNQCLGRVIRHKKDWGAIFLLDDRFLNDSQNSQLSGWMRPSLKKFTQFGDALNGFRSFLTTAMNDQSLVLTTSVPRYTNLTVHTNPLLAIERRPLNDSVEIGSAVERQVSIGESLLSSERDGNYIDPRHLLSQPQQHSAAVAAILTNRQPSWPAPSTAPSSASGGLMSTMDQLMKGTAGGQKFGLLARKTSVSSTSSSTGQAEAKERDVVDLVRPASAPVIAVKQERSSQFSLSSTRAAPGLSQMSQLSQSPDDWKTVVADLRKVLPASSMERLKTALVAAKTKGLALISQVRMFVDTINSLLSELPLADKQRHMLLLTCLVGASLRDTYVALVRQAITAAGNRTTATTLVKEERSGEVSGAPKRPVRPVLSEGNGQIHSEEVLAHSSKRAKMLLSSSTQQQQHQQQSSQNENNKSHTNSLMASLSQLNSYGSSSSSSSAKSLGTKRPGFLSELNSVPDLAVVRRPKAGLATGTSEKVTCGVCNVVSPQNPCANKCGHIICETCWTQWLLNNNTCPFCRQPASMQTITRLNITR